MSLVDAISDYGRAGLTHFAAGESAALEDQAPDPADAERMLVRSQEIERAAALDLESGDVDVRELAAAQLAAAAALDLAAAVDTLRLDTDQETAGLSADDGEGSSFERTYEKLRPLLEAETALGARDGLGPPPEAPEEAVAALEAPDAVAPLRAAVDKAIAEIAGDAASIGGAAIDGLKEIPQDMLFGAFGTAVDKLLGQLLQRAKKLVRLALKHVIKAVSKLLRLLGPLEATARRWLLDKLGGVTQDKLVAFAVDRVLEVPRLRGELKEALDNAADGRDGRLGDAEREVASLATRFGWHERIVGLLATLLDKLRAWLLGLAQWAAAAVAGVYLLMLTYGVWVAGDFLDWYRTRAEGRLDFVSGVRTTVLAAARPEGA